MRVLKRHEALLGTLYRAYAVAGSPTGGGAGDSDGGRPSSPRRKGSGAGNGGVSLRGLIRLL